MIEKCRHHLQFYTHFLVRIEKKLHFSCSPWKCGSLYFMELCQILTDFSNFCILIIRNEGVKYSLCYGIHRQSETNGWIRNCQSTVFFFCLPKCTDSMLNFKPQDRSCDSFSRPTPTPPPLPSSEIPGLISYTYQMQWKLWTVQCWQEVIVLLLAVIVNGDQISTLNTVSLVLCLSGIVVHVILKATASREYKHWIITEQSETSYLR